MDAPSFSSHFGLNSTIWLCTESHVVQKMCVLVFGPILISNIVSFYILYSKIAVYQVLSICLTVSVSFSLLSNCFAPIDSLSLFSCGSTSYRSCNNGIRTEEKDGWVMLAHRDKWQSSGPRGVFRGGDKGGGVAPPPIYVQKKTGKRTKQFLASGRLRNCLLSACSSQLISFDINYSHAQKDSLNSKGQLRCHPIL